MSSIKAFKISLVAIIMLVSALAIPFTPLVNQENVSAESPDSGLANWADGIDIIDLSQDGIFGPVVGGVTGSYSGMMSGFASLTGIGMAYNILLNLGSFGSGGQFTEAERQMYYWACTEVNKTVASLGWSKATINQVTNDLPLMALQYARWAEISARALYYQQELAETAHNYNATYVLENSELLNASLETALGALKNAQLSFNIFDNLAEQFVGDYSSMYWSFDAGGDGRYYRAMNVNPAYTNTYGSPSQLLRTPDGMMRTLNKISDTGSTSTYRYVTWSPETPVYAVWGQAPNEGKTLTVNVKNSAGVIVSTFSQSNYGGTVVKLEFNDSLPAGRYGFSVYGELLGAIYGGFGCDPITSFYPRIALVGFSKTTGGNLNFIGDVNINPTTGLISRSFLPAYIDMGYADTPAPSISISTGTSGVAIPIVNITQILTCMSNEMIKAKTVLVSSNSLALTQYNAYVAQGGMPAELPWVDVTWPGLDQIQNMSTSALALMYRTYLVMIQSYLENNTIPMPDNFDISGESVDLFVRGALYDSTGKQIYNNRTVWTPAVLQNSMNFVIGNNTFTQEGFTMSWYNSTSSIAHTIENLSVSSERTAHGIMDYYSMYQLHNGYYAIIEELYYLNQTVTTASLTVTKLSIAIGVSNEPDDLPPGGDNGGSDSLSNTDLTIGVIGGVVWVCGILIWAYGLISRKDLFRYLGMAVTFAGSMMVTYVVLLLVYNWLLGAWETFAGWFKW